MVFENCPLFFKFDTKKIKWDDGNSLEWPKSEKQSNFKTA